MCSEGCAWAFDYGTKIWDFSFTTFPTIFEKEDLCKKKKTKKKNFDIYIMEQNLRWNMCIFLMVLHKNQVIKYITKF